MFKVVSNVLVIAIMLVAFIGQTLAFNSAMSCETSVESSALGFSELVKHKIQTQLIVIIQKTAVVLNVVIMVVLVLPMLVHYGYILILKLNQRE